MRAPEVHALCLSGGAAFGAYQAGAWLELSQVWKPNLVVGLSAGALNAYAIAAEMPPQQLADRWLNLPAFSRHRIRFPSWPTNGYLDPSPLESVAKELCDFGKPKSPLGVVALQWNGFRQVLFRNEEITWQHLAASCSIPLAYPQYQINGHRYGDGGMLGALPIWAAIQMGATHVVAIDVSPRLPSVVRYPLLALKRWRMGRRSSSSHSEVVVVKITAKPPLGSWSAAVTWNKDRAHRYLERGRIDAKAAWAAIS